ncbi:MAG: DUF5717 family protein [Defluviitaleaceae bacterium]|nr:DUF5717 family protein [Defluviitaleaceae bacterium]
MNKRLEHLEHPIPKIALSTGKINVEGSGIVDGSFEIINIGEGELAGKVASVADFLSFSPVNFCGNKVRVEYSLDLNGLTGRHKTSAVITSNGGEKMLLFDVHVVPAAIVARDGTQIATLEHFLAYAQRQPVGARQLFTQRDFMIWLFNAGYSSMDIYESFAADPNKERAVDNFLIFNGLKGKACIVAQDTDVTLSVGQNDNAVTGGICLRPSTWGYVEGNLTVAKGADWLKLSKSRVTSTDFGEDGMAEVDYIVLADKLKGRDMAVVHLDDGSQRPTLINIWCNIAAPFNVRLDKESYFFEDKGRLHITNNTGSDLMIDIYCENFIKFEAKRYFISKTAEIGFDIKFSTIKAATLALRKQLYAATQIHVVAVGGEPGAVCKLNLKLWGTG